MAVISHCIINGFRGLTGSQLKFHGTRRGSWPDFENGKKLAVLNVTGYAGQIASYAPQAWANRTDLEDISQTCQDSNINPYFLKHNLARKLADIYTYHCNFVNSTMKRYTKHSIFIRKRYTKHSISYWKDTLTLNQFGISRLQEYTFRGYFIFCNFL